MRLLCDHCGEEVVDITLPGLVGMVSWALAELLGGVLVLCPLCKEKLSEKLSEVLK
mgnify:FL=1